MSEGRKTDDEALARYVAEFRRSYAERCDKIDPQAADKTSIVVGCPGERGLSDDEEEYLHGKCHLLAVALHELTGLQMGAYLDEAWVETAQGEIEMVVLVHAFVVDGDHAIDIRGRVPLDEVLDADFEINEPWLVTPTPEELLSLGEGRKRVSRKNPRFVDAMRHARILADRLDLSPASGDPDTPAPR